VNTLEARLCREMHAESQLIAPDSLRELRLPEPSWRLSGPVRFSPRPPGLSSRPSRRRPRGSTRGPRGSTRRPGTLRRRGLQQAVPWIKPLAAAAAVVAVIAGTLALARQVPGPSPQRASAAAVGAPRDYAYTVGQAVTHRIDSHTAASVYVNTQAVVRSTATGKAVTTVHVPRPYNDLSVMTADALGTVFVFGAVRMTWQGAGSDGTWKIDSKTPMLLMRLDVTRAGHTELGGVPSAGTFDATTSSIALSPAGNKLALAYGGEGQTAVVRVATLATGGWRQWTQPKATWTPVLAQNGAWTANGKTLVYQKVALGHGPGVRIASPTTSVGLLDTASPGGSLAAGSRPVALRAPPHGATPRGVSITPDGTKLTASVYTWTQGWGLSHRGELVDYSARTGAIVDTRGTWRSSGPGQPAGSVLWSSPSGRQLIVLRPEGRTSVLGVLTGNKFSRSAAGLPPFKPAGFRKLQSAVTGNENAAGPPRTLAW